MQTEYDIVKYNEKKRMNKKRRLKSFFNKSLKGVLFLCVAVFAYLISYKISGFYKTNMRLLTLLVCMVLGFGLFYLINFLVETITKKSISKKTQKAKELNPDLEVELNKILSQQNFKFEYNFNLTISENLSQAFILADGLLKEVAKRYGKVGKYYYLNYTVYDFLMLFEDVSKGVYDKVDGFFSLLKLQDTPLDIVENKLVSLIEMEKQLEKKEQDIQEQTGIKKALSNIKKKILSVGAKVTTFVFKTQIEETINEIIVFVAKEAFKI